MAQREVELSKTIELKPGIQQTSVSILKIYPRSDYLEIFTEQGNVVKLPITELGLQFITETEGALKADLEK